MLKKITGVAIDIGVLKGEAKQAKVLVKYAVFCFKDGSVYESPNLM